MKSIGIVGAGCSGLAAAHILHNAGYTVTVFERSDEVGGRAATRQRHGFIYDHGAQYVKGGSPVSSALITERFPAADLVDIAKPVWVFDQRGHIQEGDPLQNREPRWTYRSGLNTLAREMARGLEIRGRTRIGHLRRTRAGWSLFDSLGHPVGEFERVATLLDEPLSSPCFTDLCHWRDALPAETADAEQLNAIALPLGLAFCGDAYVGGHVHLALEHGVAVARQIAGT